MRNAQNTVGNRGNALHWTIASVAMLLVGILAVFLMNNRPAPPYFSELTIDSGPSPSLRRGARLVVSGGGIQRTFPVDSAEFMVTEGGTLHPDIPSGPFSARYSIPFELAEPLEAALIAECSGCQVQIKHGKTLLAASDPNDELGVARTERLPFPAGTTDITVDITVNDGRSSFKAWWETNPDGGQEDFPVFNR